MHPRVRLHKVLQGHVPSRRHASTADWPTSAAPTPHEILRVRRGVPYSKARFNELVKLYHPDVANSPLSPSVRLQRYRLVVAAHTILSDPAKRRMYESHAANTPYGPYTAPRTREEAPSTARQHPMYASNGAFGILLVVLSLFGAGMQLRRLRRARGEAAELLEDGVAGEVEAWRALLHGQSRDERIVAFLARRHGVSRLEGWAAKGAGF